MSGWHAVVPIKPAAERKSRLRGHLDLAAIEALTENMLDHVLDVLTRTRAIDAVTILAAQQHPGWTGGWLCDHSDGLNEALTLAARTVPRRLLIIHADLPGLGVADVDALVDGAAQGSALAPDRHDHGTNALAIEDATAVPFAFGAGSFARHQNLLPGGHIVRRPGLALDIDLPADLDEAIRQGHLPSWSDHKHRIF